MGIESYITKEKIEKEKEISIPENAKYLRLRKGEVLFFTEKTNSKNNGFIDIPYDSLAVNFPEYRRHMYHIIYGNVCFKQK